MEVAGIILSALLAVWFFGCIVTYKIGKHVLVEGMGVKSVEFAMLLLYGSGLLLYYWYRPAGQWVLLSVLILWMTAQFFCHWAYTIFGASERKLSGYNQCFQNTLRLVPLSDKRLIPDLYHIVLHLLIFLNIVLTVLGIYIG